MPYITGMSLGFVGTCYIYTVWSQIGFEITSFFHMVVSSSDLLSLLLHVGVPHHPTFLFAFNICGHGNQRPRLRKIMFNRKHKL